MIDYDLKDWSQRSQISNNSGRLWLCPTTDHNHNHKDSQLWMKQIVVVVDWRSSTTTIFVLVGVVTPSPRSENGFSEKFNGEWGKREANRIASPWRKVWHPFVPSRRMEMALQGWNKWEEVRSSQRMAHSSSPEEKKLGFPFSENGPSAIQGHAANSPFSDLEEWD